MATIQLLEQGLMANAAAQGESLTAGLRALQKFHECMGDVRGMGLMVAVELVKDRETKERATEWRNQIIQKAFSKGLLLLECRDRVGRRGYSDLETLFQGAPVRYCCYENCLECAEGKRSSGRHSEFGNRRSEGDGRGSGGWL